MERMPLLFHVAFKHLTRRRQQTLVAVSGVMVGVGFFLAVSAMMVGSQADFIKRLIDAAPHIIISDEIRNPPPQPGARTFWNAAIAIHGFKARKEVRGLKDNQRILSAVSAIPGAIASPSLTGAITLRLGGREEGLALIGVEPGIEAKVIAIDDNLEQGRLRDLETTQGGVIIGRDVADRLGLGMHDTVNATSPSGGVRTLRIVGLIKKGSQLGMGSAYVLLREAQSLLGRPFIINRIGIRLPDSNASQDVARRIEEQFGYKAESWQERSADLLSLLVTRNVIMYSVVSAILLVASFGIYTVVSNSVSDKRRDIAIMRSIGFSERDLQLIFVIEGLALALTGIVFGWLFGYGLLAALGSINFPILGGNGRLPLDRGPTQYLIAAAASLFAGAIAAWVPARKAARVDPVDILRGAA